MIHFKSIFERCKLLIQYILPHRLIAKTAYCVAQCKVNWFKNLLIYGFIKRYHVNLSEAEYEDYRQFENFNAFFTRQLKPGVRPFKQEKGAIISPVDGAISQVGSIQAGRIFQAKGHDYSLFELLGMDFNAARSFTNGKFMTLYLSPKDYHRIHMPVDGVLEKMIYIPGRFFSVNNYAVANVSNLFARNERVVCLFQTPYGAMIMVLVGAMIVGSIETAWSGIVNQHHRGIQVTDYQLCNDSDQRSNSNNKNSKVYLKQGEWMGSFQLGSTVIVLFEKQAQLAEGLLPDLPIKLGQSLGSYL